jgi:rhodanese-related sulfurtransferase
VSQIGAGQPPSVTADELNPASPILDVREDDEWAAGHIDGAIHVPLGQLINRMNYDPGALLSDEPIVVTCKGGGRAGQAVTWLNANGFEAVLLDGSMLGWQHAGRPMVSDTDAPPVVL